MLRSEAKALGLKRYSPGTTCPQWHIGERYVVNGLCAECLRIKAPAITKRWRAKQDPEALRQKRTEEARRRRKRNPEKANERARLAYHKGDKKKAAATHKRWKAKNKAHIAAYDAKWKREHPDEFRQKCQRRERRRNAREVGAAGTFTKADIDSMLIEQDGKCNACKVDISRKYDIDHMMPLSRGGSNDRDNLQLLCKSCNCQKSSRTMEEWQATKEIHCNG